MLQLCSYIIEASNSSDNKFEQHVCLYPDLPGFLVEVLGIFSLLVDVYSSRPSRAGEALGVRSYSCDLWGTAGRTRAFRHAAETGPISLPGSHGDGKLTLHLARLEQQQATVVCSHDHALVRYPCLGDTDI